MAVDEENDLVSLICINLPGVTLKITFDGILLLMLDIHAKYVPWTMTNTTRVDAKDEFSI